MEVEEVDGEGAIGCAGRDGWGGWLRKKDEGRTKLPL